MPVNPSIESPTLRTLPTLANGAYDFGQRSLRGVDVWAAGTLHVADICGNETTRTFAAPFPVRWTLQIGKIFSDSGIDVTTNIDCLQ